MDHSEVFSLLACLINVENYDQFTNLEFFKVKYYVEFSSLKNLFWNLVLVFDLNLMLVYTMHALKSISDS